MACSLARRSGSSGTISISRNARRWSTKASLKSMLARLRLGVQKVGPAACLPTRRPQRLARSCSLPGQRQLGICFSPDQGAEAILARRDSGQADPPPGQEARHKQTEQLAHVPANLFLLANRQQGRHKGCAGADASRKSESSLLLYSQASSENLRSAQGKVMEMVHGHPFWQSQTQGSSLLRPLLCVSVHGEKILKRPNLKIRNSRHEETSNS